MIRTFRFGHLIIVDISIDMAQANTVQRSRWNFTLHNYNIDTNYKEYLLSNYFFVKRAVIGYERGTVNETQHIQGYLEFSRTLRLINVRRIFDTVHWSPSVSNAAINFIYCSKGHTYDVIGDFSREMTLVSDKAKPASVGMVVEGLLDNNLRVQVQSSKEYSEKANYYDKISSKIYDMKQMITCFETWRHKLLYHWQYAVLETLFGQNDREILWVCDKDGNNGKTFISHLLNICYNYLLCDGSVNTRDMAFLLPDNDIPGACIDVCRAAGNQLDFMSLENLKNGYVISGKYAGKVIRFVSPNILILSNFYPDITRLSADRWRVLTLGD